MMILALWTTIYLTAAVTARTSVLLPFGEDEGDVALPPGDEDTSSIIYLKHDFNFFGNKVYKFYINTNGVISLNEGFPTFYPKEFPFSLAEETAMLIAPFYADADTSGDNGGTIYHRELYRDDENDYLFRRLERMIYADYYENYSFNETNFEALFMFIVTWDSVSYFSDEAKADHTNTFQAVLLSDQVESYVFFNYDDINWSTGVSPHAKANADGTGGQYGAIAKIGFNYGDGINGYMMNVSGTIDVLFVDETSNIGIPGRWVFKVDGKEIDVPSEDVQVMCPFDWEYLEVEFACYKFISDHLNWKDATERCKADGGLIGHLATITTPEKNEFIAGPITGGVKTWIGGTRDQFNETHWEWVTGEPWSFEKWRQREPNNWGKAEHCLNTNFVRPGLWNDHFCQNKKASICEMFPIVDAITAGGDRV
ncbi:sushi, nidogen and EGF-like domain-containing protein 1 [Apostichopus japonicus]|uniref:sushi, nidogen and EGF-like domain-containing protein 1 n=1 Tax=Stichopus japonicus TaxID=307972 RepID=UPI003AB6E69C